MTVHPPAWAQALVSALVPRRTRDSVIGDLIEEYHDTQVREHGVAAADRWYIRQALGFLWSAAAVPGALVGSILTVRMLLDVAAPIPDTADRAWITTFAMMTLFTLSGFRLGLLTRRISGAIATALAATAIGTVAAYVAAFASMGIAGAFVHPGAEAWASLREGLDVPAHVIALIGTTLACAGAAFGRAFPKWPLPVSS
jgi:hypothetical protein